MEISIYSLIASVFVGGVAGYLGSLMITKKMTLVGDALGHVALPGMGLALYFGFNVSLGALLFLLLGILMIWYLETKTNLPTETLVGIIFVLSLSIGFLITPDLELLEALVGDIAKISVLDFWITVFTSLIVLYGVRKIYPKLMLSFVSPDIASANGISVKKYNLLYLLSIAVIVALGVKVVGSLLVGALVIVPAAAAKNLSNNMRQYVFLSVIIGMFSCVVGIIIANQIVLPTGPIVILTSVFFFVFSLIFSVDK